MIRRFGWVDNLPVEVEVTRVEFGGAREVELSFTEWQLKLIKSWISDGFDKLFVVGTISEKVEEAS